MKKRVIIGDLHGIGTWKDIVEKENPDCTIFLGDYFDSFNLDTLTQKLNFEDLAEYKKSNNVIWLLGNHDYHYLSGSSERYSGYSDSTYFAVSNLIEKAIDNDMKIVFLDYINRTIYSHAGVSQNWIDEYCDGNLEQINNASLDYLRFTYRDGGDWYGSSTWNSPIWIRPEGLYKCPYKDKDGNIWNQVFGHTHIVQPTKHKIDNAEFWDMDCLNNGYYMLEKLDEKGKLICREIRNVFND